jgi:hypothetical protein
VQNREHYFGILVDKANANTTCLAAKAFRMPMRVQRRDEFVRDGLLAAVALWRELAVEAVTAMGRV